MTFETLRAFFGWCTLVNWAILVVWWLYMVLADAPSLRDRG